jgi:hypothetical protein
MVLRQMQGVQQRLAARLLVGQLLETLYWRYVERRDIAHGTKGGDDERRGASCYLWAMGRRIIYVPFHAPQPFVCGSGVGTASPALLCGERNIELAAYASPVAVGPRRCAASRAAFVSR